MPFYRITIRHGRPQRYHVVDVEADDLAGATRGAADHVPVGAATQADLVEIRRLADPDDRTFVGAG